MVPWAKVRVFWPTLERVSRFATHIVIILVTRASCPLRTASWGLWYGWMRLISVLVRSLRLVPIHRPVHHLPRNLIDFWNARGIDIELIQVHSLVDGRVELEALVGVLDVESRALQLPRIAWTIVVDVRRQL